MTEDNSAKKWFDLGEDWEKKGRDRRAIEYFEKAVTIWKESPKNHEEIGAETSFKLAKLWRGQGNYRKTAESFRNALYFYEQKSPGEASMEKAGCYFQLGILNDSLARPKRALPELEKAATMLKECCGETHDATQTVQIKLSEIKAKLETQEENE